METTLRSSSQGTSVSVLMINDNGLMISVQGQDYFPLTMKRNELDRI